LIDSQWQPLAWDRRQCQSDKDETNSSRQARYREQRKLKVTGSNAPVTHSNALRNATVTGIDTDTDTDKEGGACVREPAPKREEAPKPPPQSAIASPPPIFSTENQEFIKTERPDLDPQAVWRNFCDHYPAEKCTDAAWRKWVRREMKPPTDRGSTVPATPTADPDSKASVEALGMATGIGRWDQLFEPWAVYKNRVRSARLEHVTL
jgi:hypothetical protein